MPQAFIVKGKNGLRSVKVGRINKVLCQKRNMNAVQGAKPACKEAAGHVTRCVLGEQQARSKTSSSLDPKTRCVASAVTAEPSFCLVFTVALVSSTLRATQRKVTASPHVRNFIFIATHKYIYIYVCMNRYIYMYVCMYIYACIYICMYVYILVL